MKGKASSKSRLEHNPQIQVQPPPVQGGSMSPPILCGTGGVLNTHPVGRLPTGCRSCEEEDHCPVSGPQLYGTVTRLPCFGGATFKVKNYLLCDLHNILHFSQHRRRSSCSWLGPVNNMAADDGNMKSRVYFDMSVHMLMPRLSVRLYSLHRTTCARFLWCKGTHISAAS